MPWSQAQVSTSSDLGNPENLEHPEYLEILDFDRLLFSLSWLATAPSSGETNTVITAVSEGILLARWPNHRWA